MVEKYSFPPRLDEWIAKFFKALTLGDAEFEEKFLKDTKWHNEAVQTLNKKVFHRIDDLKPEELKKLIEDKHERAMMQVYENHRKDIFTVIDNDFDRVKRYLTFIKNFDGAPSDINSLLDSSDSSDSKHIKGAGILFVTQLLAGAHLNEYVVFHEKIYVALQNFCVIPIGSKIDTGSRYICINTICKQMYKEKFEERMKASHKFGLQSVHNFLWHYHYYIIRAKKCWWDKDC